MDEFAALSQQRAVDVAAERLLRARDHPGHRSPDGTVIDKDDGPRAGTTVEKLAQLKPVFRPDGTVTAGNACPLNDGAAAVRRDERHAGRASSASQPLARVVSSGVSALNPEIMGLGPIGASRQALGRAGLTIDDIDLVEINEAFAAQVIPSAKHLGIPWEKLNVHGGAIALGHPFGMTGARIMTTLLNGLEDAGGRYGLETHVRRRRPGHGHDRRTPHLTPIDLAPHRPAAPFHGRRSTRRDELVLSRTIVVEHATRRVRHEAVEFHRDLHVGPGEVEVAAPASR